MPSPSLGRPSTARRINCVNLSPIQKRWLVRAAKIAVLGLLGWGMHATLSRAIADLAKPEFEQHLWHMHPGWLAASGAFYLAGTLPTAFFSYRLLIALGQPVTLFAVLRAFYVSQIGKYVPGKAMVIVLRASLLGGASIEKTVVTASVFIDTLTTMACGCLLATAALACTAPRKIDVILVGAGMLLVTGIPAMPVVFARLVSLLGIGRIHPGAAERLRGVSGRELAWGWLMIAAGWLLQGLSLWAVLRAVGATEKGPLDNWPLHTAAAALAVVAGFLTMIPAGFVGREFVLTELMAPEYGPAMAALSALVLRLVWLVAEVLVSCILYFLGSSPPAAVHETDPPPT